MDDDAARKQLDMAFTSGQLKIVERAARRVSRVTLDDALRILALMGEVHDGRYGHAAARWVARAVNERRLDLVGAQRALELVALLPEQPRTVDILRREYGTRSHGPRAAE